MKLENTTTMLLTPNPVFQGTTTAVGTTATTAFVIDGKKGEREFNPKKVSSTLSVSTAGTTVIIATNNHNNQEYQRALNQLKQANVVRDTQEMIAAQSPDDLDALLAMIDAKEQKLASLEQQEEKVHIKHL